MSVGREGVGARVPSPKGLAEWSRWRQLDRDQWRQQALVGTTQCCRGDGAGAWERHGAVGSRSCCTPFTQCLGSTCSHRGVGACAFPKGHLGHHSPRLKQRAQWKPLREQEEQKSLGSSLC